MLKRINRRGVVEGPRWYRQELMDSKASHDRLPR